MHRVELKAKLITKTGCLQVLAFLMHRVELKDPPTPCLRVYLSVPNAPCGVESFNNKPTPPKTEDSS